MSFERKVNCISILKSALSVTVYIIVVTVNLESEEWTTIELKQEQAKIEEKY